MSDVDLALVVAEPGIHEHIASIQTLVRDRFDSDLANRLSIFWASWKQVHDGAQPPARLPELDRLDLLDSGVLVYGDDYRFEAKRPHPDSLIVQAAEFALAKFDAEHRRRLANPQLLVEDGPRAATKAVLFPIRFLYTLHTGQIGRNDDAADWYTGAGSELVDAAMRWRLDGIANPDTATSLLRVHLINLYRHFVTEYSARLRILGRASLADQLINWRHSLDAT